MLNTSCTSVSLRSNALTASTRLVWQVVGIRYKKIENVVIPLTYYIPVLFLPFETRMTLSLADGL